MTYGEGLQLKKQIVLFAVTDGFERQATDQFAVLNATGSFILRTNYRKEENNGKNADYCFVRIVVIPESDSVRASVVLLLENEYSNTSAILPA